MLVTWQGARAERCFGEEFLFFGSWLSISSPPDNFCVYVGLDFSSGCRQEYKFSLEYFIEVVFAVKSSVALSHHLCLKCEAAPSHFTQRCLLFIFQISANIWLSNIWHLFHCHADTKAPWQPLLSLEDLGLFVLRWQMKKCRKAIPSISHFCALLVLKKRFYFFVFSPWVRHRTKPFHNFSKPDHRNALEWALVRQEGLLLFYYWMSLQALFGVKQWKILNTNIKGVRNPQREIYAGGGESAKGIIGAMHTEKSKSFD